MKTEKTAIEKLKEANNCPWCDGSGVIDFRPTEFEGTGDCPSCNGAGHLIDLQIINSALSEAERKAWIDGTKNPIYLTKSIEDEIIIPQFENWRSKHGAKT
jgi:hypothetical protein